MIIRYFDSMKGVRYYQVFLQGEEVFMGTLGECKRYIVIHNEKVLLRQEMDRKSRVAG